MDEIVRAVTTDGFVKISAVTWKTIWYLSVTPQKNGALPALRLTGPQVPGRWFTPHILNGQVKPWR